MLRTLRRVPSVARIVYASPRSAVRVSMVRLPLSALPTPQGSSTEEWSLIVALCRPRQGRQKANFCTALGGLRRLLFSLFYRRATWSVGRPGAAFSTPMSVALQRRLPRRRPPCPCCKFTSSTAISTELAINAWWISLYVPPRYPPRYCQTLRHRYQTVFEQRLSAGIRVTSHHGILHDFHHQLLHPAPLMNSPSSSTCSHLLLVTSSHLDFPGGVMNRLSSPVGVLAP